MPASLVDAATIWASAATLIAVAAAWFTYAAADVSARREVYEGLNNTVVGLERELKLIELWAGPSDSPGYLRSKPPGQYRQEASDWQNPARIIFTFDCPTIKSLTQSKYVNRLQSILDEFVVLNYSIVRLYNFYDEYRRYVVARPVLYDSLVRKFAQRSIANFSEEAEYVEQVFMYNYRIHLDFIGGADSTDERCLYNAFRKAKGALENFRTALRREPLPKAYWLLHAISVIFLLASLLLILEWTGLTHVMASGSPPFLPS